MPTHEEIRALVRQVLAEMSGEATAPVASPAEAGTRVAVGADHGGFPLKQRLAAPRNGILVALPLARSCAPRSK